MKINPKLKNDLKRFLMDKIQEEKSIVTVYSACLLSDEDKKNLGIKFKELDWKKARFEIDKSVIAGVVIKIGSRTIDLSLLGTLSKLTNTLYEID